VTTVDAVHPGSQLRIRVLDGSITAAALGVTPTAPATEPEPEPEPTSASEPTDPTTSGDTDD
jgi:exodeoxyribonuclease VII large subunit